MLPYDYWSKFFGLAVAELRVSGVRVLAHKELAGYNGAYIFKIADSITISVPDEIKASIESRLKSPELSEYLLSGAYLSGEFAEHLFDNVDVVVGPCYQGCYSKHPDVESGNIAEQIKLLDPCDLGALDGLRQQVEPVAWDHSAIAADKITFGYFESGQIVAAACLDMWSEAVANIGLVTHPSHRGKGYSKRLCVAATRHGIDQGYLMLYQTLLSNRAAVAVARDTGYLEYARHLAVRFAGDPDCGGEEEQC